MPSQPKPNEVSVFSSPPEMQRLLSEREAETALTLAYAASVRQDIEMARKFQATVNDGLDAKRRERHPCLPSPSETRPISNLGSEPHKP